MGNNTALQFPQDEVQNLLWVIEKLLKKEKFILDAKRRKQLDNSNAKLTRYLFEMRSKGYWNEELSK